MPPNFGGAAAAAAAFSRSIRASAAAAVSLAIAIPPLSDVGFSRLTTATGLASSPLRVSAPADAPSSNDAAESLLELLARELDAFPDAVVDEPFEAATFGGFAISQWNILLMATYQTVIPTELYGRIHGTRRTLVWGMMPIGSLLGGVLAHYSLRLPMYVGGVVASILAFGSIGFLLNIAESAKPVSDAATPAA